MAQIDLKNCLVYFEDGYSGPGGSGTVNNVSGYTAGATTMVVQGYIGAVATGDQFNVVGSVDTNGNLINHKITAHTDTSGNTTSVTFTPGLGGVVSNGAAITILSHQLQIRVGDGNIQWTEKRPVTYVKDRGLLDTVRLGDQEPVEVKLDITWIFLASQSSDTIPTPEEALKRTGKASTWTSASPDPCEPYAITIYILYTPPCPGVEDEKYLLSMFRYEDLAQDLKTGMIAVTGKCNVIQAGVVRG